MSGLEVTGVVLGSVPLIISALEHYRDGIRVMNNIRNYATIFDDYSSQLNASIGIYRDICCALLGPLNLPDSQTIALLDEGQIEAWSDEVLQKALKVRLGYHYHRYASLQDKLNNRILLFFRKLKLKDNGQPPWIGSGGVIDEKARKKFFQSFWVKTIGGLNTGSYEDLLVGIDRDIAKLSKLIDGANVLEPIRVEKRNKLHAAYWQSTRDQAERLFDNLSSRFSSCACTHHHQANLRLDIRKDDVVEDDTIRFAFLLAFDKRSHPTSPPPWDWREIEIESSQLAGTAVAVTPSQIQMPGKKTVCFAPPITVSSPSRPSLSRSSLLSLAANTDNLCRALLATYQQDCCVGVLEDEAWQYHVYLVTGPASKAQIFEAASLNDFIHGGTTIGHRQKCFLALTLASSVLQLHNTPWLPQAWEMKDLLFLRNHHGEAIPSQFYVSQTFTSTSQVATPAKRRRLVKNESVYALGVALLELTYGASIMSFKKQEDLNEDGKEDGMTEVSIAIRLARGLKDRESQNYALAVLRCIECTFDTFAFDFNDREFREAFYQAVLVPLQEEYRYATRRL